MAQCRWCSSKGLFLKVSRDGLCARCQPLILHEIAERSRILADCIRLCEESKTLATRLSRCDLLLEHASELQRFEARGIDVMSPAPSVLIARYREKRDAMIVDSLAEDLAKAVSKAEIVDNTKSAATTLKKVLLKIHEARGMLLAPSSGLGELESRAKTLVHRAELRIHLEAADRAEFKGQQKKALEHFREALYFLQNDGIDDTLQREYIDHIQGKINTLNGLEG